VSDDAITDLASAVADDEAIDWETARSRLTPQDQSIAEELRALSRLSGSQRPRGSGRGSARLSWGLEAIRVLAIVSASLGAAGYLVAMVIAGRQQNPVLFGMCIVFALAGLMLDSGRSDRRARALGGAYWSIAASFGAFGIPGFQQIWPNLWVLAVFISMRPEAFFGAFLWDFAREFPRITRFSRLDAVCRAGLIASFVVGVVLFAANVIPAVSPESTLARWAAPAQRMTKYAPLFWNLVFACALPALIVVGVRARRAAGDEGRRARRFLYAIVLTLGPVLLEIVGEGLFPRFRNTVEAYRWWLGWIVYPLLISLPLSTAYIVAASDVLEVRVVIQRGLRYLLTRWLILWGAIVPVGILAMNLYLHRDQPLGVTLATRPSQRLLWVSAVCIVLLMLRQRLTSLLDRLLVPGAVDPATMLAHMAERLKTSRTPLEVTRTLAEAAERALQADTRIYIRRDDQLIPLEGGITMPANSVIAVLAAGAREPCMVSPQAGSYYRLLPDADRAWIDSERIYVFLPITGSRADSSLVGMIALKERRNALRYTEDDMRFLRAASASASLACETLTISRDGPTSPAEPEEVAIECANCGRVTSWQAPPCNCGGTWRAAALPLRFGNRFDLVRRLGAGGMGIVYLATDSVLRRELAVKTITRLSETAASRLITEAQAMASFSHQHIAVLYGIERWRDTPILLMEYMTGQTLAERLRIGPLGEADALSIMRQLAVGLEAVHGRGLFHGDIKPSNIGFTRDGVAKFLDFGLAHFAVDLAEEAGDREDDAAGKNFIAGTPAYMSPEVRDGAPRGAEMDVWALSVVLLETLIGEPPLRVPKRGSDIRDGVDRALKRIDTRVSSALVDFLHKSLAPEARRYPANAQDLRQALADLSRSEPF
jgi:hypothetical protein